MLKKLYFLTRNFLLKKIKKKQKKYRERGKNIKLHFRKEIKNAQNIKKIVF